jgi:septal ring factor EnvC (AmiA/AmiB activator)
MRFLPCFFFLVLLSGCNFVSFPTGPSPSDKDLFTRGMDELDVRGNPPAAFAVLQESFPESPWSQRALKINELLETVRSQQKSIERMERDKKSCRQDSEKLQKKVDELEKERKKLRQVLIDLEKRRR